MNCVVICCDTFRHDMIGHPVVRVPNLDRLAREGITFTHAFAEGLPTIQARRTCFTGKRCFPWNIEMGSRGLTPAIPGWHRIPDDQTTLSEFLYDQGVVTGFVADTYHMFKPTQNFTRGFCSWDFIRGQEGDPVRSGPLSAIDLSPYLPDGSNDPTRWPTLTQYLLNMLDRHTEEDYLPARVFRRACTWLEENRENDPWFLWVDSFAPHERWDPPFEFADAYYQTDRSGNFIQPQLVNGIDAAPEVIERTKALYYGYVTFVDKWIGAFLDKLDQMGRMDDTAVLFTSDHGTELWDKGRFGKGGDRLHQYNTGIPLLVRLPDGSRAGTTCDDGSPPGGGELGSLPETGKLHPRAGTTCEDFVQHQDFFPAICRLMGFEPDREFGLDGRDFLDEATTPPDKVITAWGPNASVRSKRWNLSIDTSEGGEKKELYDLEADPTESENVYDAEPEAATEMTAYLEATLGPLPYAIQHVGDRRQAPPLWYTKRQQQ